MKIFFVIALFFFCTINAVASQKQEFRTKQEVVHFIQNFDFEDV